MLVQAFYHAEFLFTVSPYVFDPPPKVDSGVLRLTRKEIYSLPCDEALFFKIVKASFNQRRKTIRNSLKSVLEEQQISDLGINPGVRAEALSLEDFAKLANAIAPTE